MTFLPDIVCVRYGCKHWLADGVCELAMKGYNEEACPYYEDYQEGQFCPECDVRLIKPDLEFCPECGANLGPDEDLDVPRAKPEPEE